MPTEENEPAIPASERPQHKNIHAPVVFEPTISAGERPQTYALDRAATGIDIGAEYMLKLFDLNKNWILNLLKIHSQVFVIMRTD